MSGRSALLQPFTSTSPWNLPIGASATYSNPNPKAGTTSLIMPTGKILHISPIVVCMDISSVNVAEIDILNQDSSTITGSNQTTCEGTGSALITLPADNRLVVPASTDNVGWAGVHTDGKTYTQSAGYARCSGTHGVLSYATLRRALNQIIPGHHDQDLTSDGLVGSTGASCLPIHGGCIRIGELVPGGSIKHAIQLIVPSKDLYGPVGGTNQATSYRWPATTSDSYWASKYVGTNPLLTSGARLALPSNWDTSVGGANIQTPMGKILADALKYYGAIIANTGQDSIVFCAEISGRGVGFYDPVSGTDPTQGGVGDVRTEFATVWNSRYPGITLEQNSGSTTPWAQDLLAMYGALLLVGSTSTSGGNPSAADLAAYNTAVTNYAAHGPNSSSPNPALLTGIGGGLPLTSLIPDIGSGGGGGVGPIAGGPGTWASTTWASAAYAGAGNAVPTVTPPPPALVGLSVRWSCSPFSYSTYGGGINGGGGTPPPPVVPTWDNVRWS